MGVSATVKQCVDELAAFPTVSLAVALK